MIAVGEETQGDCSIRKSSKPTRRPGAWLPQRGAQSLWSPPSWPCPSSPGSTRKTTSRKICSLLSSPPRLGEHQLPMSKHHTLVLRKMHANFSPGRERAWVSILPDKLVLVNHCRDADFPLLFQNIPAHDPPPAVHTNNLPLAHWGGESQIEFQLRSDFNSGRDHKINSPRADVPARRSDGGVHLLRGPNPDG